MYRPSHFKFDDPALLAEFIQAHPLGIVISTSEDSMKINYLPFFIEAKGDKHILLGHMARANPQVKGLDNSFATISFQGPDRYISPTWYSNRPEVPTWNYTAVEVRGRIELVHSFDGTEEILAKSTEFFEKQNQTDWSYKLPQKFKENLIQHIVGIRIHIESMEGKFKLNQNYDQIDRDQVAAKLQKSTSSTDQKMLYWIEKTKRP